MSILLLGLVLGLMGTIGWGAWYAAQPERSSRWRVGLVVFTIGWFMMWTVAFVMAIIFLINV